MGPAASDEGHSDCQFPASADATSRSGTWSSCSSIATPAATLNPLPKPSIDTGAGLERVAGVLQGVISNYETDLFTPLIQARRRIDRRESANKELRREQRDQAAASLRVIADHARAATFLISDGVMPPMKAAATCCARSASRYSSRTTCSGRTNRSCIEMVFAVVT